MDASPSLSGPEVFDASCRAEIRVPGQFHMFSRCKRKPKVRVKTDRGDFDLCTQHLTKFKSGGLWVKAGMQTFIEPKHVLLAEREALGVR